VNALDTLRERETEKLAILLGEGGLLLVHGPDAQEAADVTAAALAAADGINAGEVDLDVCTDDRHVARAIVRAAADALLADARLLDIPEDRWSRAQQRAGLEVRRALGELLELIDGDWPAARPPARVIADTVTAVGQAAFERKRRVALVFFGIDALIEVPRSRFAGASELVWALRSAAQHAPRVTLMLAGGPAAVELIGEPDAAFFGWGRSLEIGRVDFETVAQATSEELGIDYRLAFRVAELSDGLPRVARLLARWLRDELADSAAVDPVGAAWTRLLREQGFSLRTTTRLLADLHRVALPVCQALANGRAPYRAAHSGEVTRALRLLHAHGVCESPKPRTWRLTDPLLAAWLRGDSTPVRHGQHSAASVGP
jgi:hypothetical protein